ncbi:MAG TPA: hypothetical protein VIM89_07125 [Mucilaginibacter sp.]
MQRQERIQDPLSINRRFIEGNLNEGKEVIVQFSGETYNDKILSELNELCLKYDESFSIRFYGFYGTSFDCKCTTKIPNVKSLYVDCLIKAHNIEAITYLKYLKKLSIGIYELTQTEILDAESFQNLNRLVIGNTKSKALNLEYLKKYHNLSHLIIAGHTKNIEAVGDIKRLNTLNLNSISKVSLSFVNHLRNLKSLYIALGGRESIQEINENEIENLGLIWIRGFNDINNIKNFKRLKTLIIEDQIRLPQINFEEPLTQLEDIKIINCKTLNSMTGIEKLSRLHQLRIYKTNIDFDSFIKQPLPSSLKILAFYTTKTKVDKDIKASLKTMGYTDGLTEN